MGTHIPLGGGHSPSVDFASAGWLRARAERSHAPAEAAAHQAVEDARMQAAAVFLEFVLPFALHGGALRIEVVEAAEAPAGRADLPGELRQHRGFGHDGGIDPASGDRTAARDAAARLAGAATTVAGRRTDLAFRAGAVAGGGAAALARSLTDAAAVGRGADLSRWAGAVAGGGAVLARRLAHAAAVGRRADLSWGAGAAAGGGAVLARGLADAAPPAGGRGADLVRIRAGAVAGGGCAVLARRLADAAPPAGGRGPARVRTAAAGGAGGR